MSYFHFIYFDISLFVAIMAVEVFTSQFSSPRLLAEMFTQLRVLVDSRVFNISILLYAGAFIKSWSTVQYLYLDKKNPDFLIDLGAPFSLCKY